MFQDEKKIKKPKKTGAGRPQKPINYGKVAYWSSKLVPQWVIAGKCGFTPECFCRRKKRDSRLRQVLDPFYNDGLIKLHIQQYETATGHNYTTCDDCGRRADYFELFSICPFCKSPHVRHSIIPGNTRLLIRLGALYLGQTRSSLLRQTKKPKTEEAKETSEEADKNWEKIISYLNAEYGENGKPSPS